MSLTLPKAIALRYKNPIFIETGTFEGGGINLALECGYAVIHSIEIDISRYEKAKQTFASMKNVTIHLGDTLGVLPSLLRDIPARATIWLDAHPFTSSDKDYGAKVRFPLSEELAALARTEGRHDHTILLDDRHAFGFLFGMMENEAEQLLLKINKTYSITYEDNLIRQKDIVVATAP